MKDSVEIFKICNKSKKVIPFYDDGLFCGEPNIAELTPEWLDVGEWFTGGSNQVFVAIVHGESMKDLGYMPGDLCIVNRELVPKEGSVVVAYIDGEFTMKVFHHDKKRKIVTLFPANDDYEPIEIDDSVSDFRVWGVVTKCIKSSRSGLTIIKTRTQQREQKENQEKDSTLTKEELKKKIDGVRQHIGTTKRLWFPVCKYMMWKRMVAEGDFTTAVTQLKELYPELQLDAKDLSKLNVLSFSKTMDKWNPDDAPVSHATYSKYLIVAELMNA